MPTYAPGTPAGRVRLLINDVGAGTPPAWVYTDAEVGDFLVLGRDRPMLAAAIALETIASDEALVLKVITTQDLSTDGAKVSDALLKRAALLRKQDADDQNLTDAASSLDFAIAYPGPGSDPELADAGPTGWPYGGAW